MGIASPAEPVPVLRPLIMVCVHHDNGGSHAIMFVVISVFWQLIDCDTLRSAPLRSAPLRVRRSNLPDISGVLPWISLVAIIVLGLDNAARRLARAVRTRLSTTSPSSWGP